jgi:nucleoside-diphosphate-sugar epimerase
MGRYKHRIETAIRIIKRQGEVSAAQLAYMFDVNHTTARQILQSAAAVDDEIIYEAGVARYVGAKTAPKPQATLEAEEEIPVSELPYMTEADLEKGEEQGDHADEG